MAAKKKTGRRKPPAGKGFKRPILDRDAYAKARAEGKARSECARIAGSKAKTLVALCGAAAKMESEDGMPQRIAIERERVIRGMDDAWEKAQARMEQLLDHPKWQARFKSADFFAKVHGGFAPKRIEHSGSVEATPTGALDELTDDGRAELRALLAREAEKAKKRKTP